VKLEESKGLPSLRAVGESAPCSPVASGDLLTSLGWWTHHQISAFICTWHLPGCASLINPLLLIKMTAILN
jgi:hypothetical protein